MKQWIILLSELLILTACSSPPGDEASGKDLFEYHCAGCHGQTGMGKTFFGYPDLTKQDLSTLHIRKRVEKGFRPGASKKQNMPAFDLLSDGQLKKLLSYIQTLKARRAKP